MLCGREFMLALAVISKRSPDDKLGAAFKLFDVDGNGWISFGEMKKSDCRQLCDYRWRLNILKIAKGNNDLPINFFNFSNKPADQFPK